jgi:hypothetical protein
MKVKFGGKYVISKQQKFITLRNGEGMYGIGENEAEDAEEQQMPVFVQ